MNEKNGFEVQAFSQTPFLVDLAAFIRGEAGAVLPSKPAALSSLSPEVLARLHFPENCARQPLREFADTGARASAGAVADDGTIDWFVVDVPLSMEDDNDETLGKGARLAISCHAALRRHAAAAVSLDGLQQQQKQQLESTVELPFSSALPNVRRCIVHGSDEEAFVGLCVCLTILEKALYDIYRAGTLHTQHRNADESSGATVMSNRNSPGVAPDGQADLIDVRDRAVVGGPAMIFRDLIATSQVKAALPEKMVTVLRVLLLPDGFNIRNLVWHGFLAPGELPRELASLVLMVTLSIPDAIATRRQDMTVLSSPPSTPRDARCPPETCRPQTTGAAFANDNTEHSQSTASLCSILEENSAGGGCRDDTIEFTAEAVPPQLPPPSLRPSLSPLSALPVKGQYQGHRSNWALDCFDDRLACPSVLVSDVHVLMRSSYRNKLEVLVRRSAFVVPGREELALFALDALREKRYLLFLVAMLPVLEHGLRCIFSCANDSPGHLFAQVHQYYSTLDGFGQRARHQLLLDQELAGYPGKPNLLLSTIGPGLSACLLDIFMMDAGPGLRGKIAHAEVDMSSVFMTTLGPDTDAKCGNSSAGSGCERLASSYSLVNYTAAVFLVLCKKFDPARTGLGRSAACGGNSKNVERESGDKHSPQLAATGDFENAFVRCEAHCMGWVPRFHPHELLEADMHACWREFDDLALALEARAVSVKRLPEGGQAQLSVVVTQRDYLLRAIPERGTDKTGEINQRERDALISQEGKGHTVDGKPVRSCPLVLTVVDTAHRLIVPATGRSNESSAARGTSRNTQAATANVPSLAARVRAALGHHCTHLAHRFERITRGRDLEDNSDVVGVSKPCDCSSRPHAVLGCEINRTSWSYVRRARRSAFAMYTHSQRCLGEALCGLECLDPAWRKCSEREACTGDAIYSMQSVAAREHRPTIGIDPGRECSESQPDEDSIPVTSSGEGGRREAKLMLDEVCASRWNGLSTRGDGKERSVIVKKPTTDTLMEPLRNWPPHRKASRFCPSTNVITAIPLPQIGCMTSLCRVCADVARALLSRIEEEEAQVASGAARSGQRRAYAATVNIAPTLLCFLASAMGAVEAFVLEWDVRRNDASRPSSGFTNDGRHVRAVNVAADFSMDQPPELAGLQPGQHGGIEVLSTGRFRTALVSNTPGTTTSSPTTAAATTTTVTAVRNKTSTKPDDNVSSGRPRNARKASTFEGKYMAASLVASVGNNRPPLRIPDCVTSSSQCTTTQPRQRALATMPTVVDSGRAFLRRLAAINGTLSLCVFSSSGRSKRSKGARGGERCRREVGRRDGGDYRSSNRDGSKLAARKGYVQALTELALFLETKAANQGFSGL